MPICTSFKKGLCITGRLLGCGLQYIQYINRLKNYFNSVSLENNSIQKLKIMEMTRSQANKAKTLARLSISPLYTLNKPIN